MPAVGAARREAAVPSVQCIIPVIIRDAVLGNHEPARTLAIKKAQSLTDKLAP